MAFLIVLAALCFLMYVAYRGHSVILFAPIAALGAVLLTDPSLVAPMFTGLFMDKMVGFLKLYFPVFLLGAIFGKLIETSGFSKSIVAATIRLVGRERAMLAIVAVCALLTYGGVSLFVVVFAVYPFAAELFRQSDIPKRLIPGTIALGAFTFTMDALPGTPQIQNIIPTAFFGTDTWAAPVLGTLGGVFILIAGLIYLNWRRRAALKAGEGYGDNLINEPAPFAGGKLAHPLLAIAPLLLVGIANKVFSVWLPQAYGKQHSFDPAVIGDAAPVVQEVSKIAAIWAVEGALLIGIAAVLVFAWKPVMASFAEGSKAAIGGALLAAMNTASEYGFGAVIAALPGFLVVANALAAIPNPLVNEAITVTALAGITGSASGGMSIALAAMADTFIANAHAASIPMEVLHRVAAMASGGMDTLPHNGAVITLLAVTGLSHRQAYKDVFAITLVKTAAVFVVIGLYYATGLV
ncbi:MULTISPECIES: GntP family permease [Lysobacter]|jgi:H+/gluconate symporter-like permease|uniref:GntP family permease n=1 Tax=Lysobacter gummosus TaxID=262324 RepID=A0ABY3XAJ7_9GAMM|nr:MULTISPECIES: GntP family permease [Lysobacter]ALN91820.1 citrate transporter family protein [Lysobacter gummosus]UJB21183.1 GntP family permease [Lysobacter capsici]UJQ29702.1 GntP family permease [Lysobacter gummosus]UNP27485.1 GntP family permease [Lysobacter gummosus]